MTVIAHVLTIVLTVVMQQFAIAQLLNPQSSATNPSNMLARTDRDGSPLPPGAISRMGSIRLRHGGYVHRMAFSPDGKTLASVGDDLPIRIWDVASGKELHQLRGHFHGVSSLVFSADSKTLISVCSEANVRSWDVARGKQLDPRGRAIGLGGAARLSPDGKLLALACSDDKAPRLSLWDIAGGKQRHVFAEDGEHDYLIVFSADGRLLASGHDGLHRIRVWETATGKLLWRLQKPEEKYLWRIVFSPDGKTLVSAGHDAVHFWDLATGNELRQLQSPKSLIMALAFAPGGAALASGCNCYSDGLNAPPIDGTITLWDAATGKKSRSLRGHLGGIGCLAFSPDGKTLASGGNDHTIRFWDLATGAERFSSAGHVGPIRAAALSPDGKIMASGGWDGIVRLWDPATGRELHCLEGHGQRITAVAFAPDGKAVVSAGTDATVRYWDTGTGRELKTVQADAYALAFAPDGKTLALGGMGQLVDSRTHNVLFKLKGHDDGTIHSLAFSPNGDVLASAGGVHDRTVRLWHAAAGKELRQFQTESGSIDDVAFSPDGKILAAVAYNTIHLWETDTGKKIRAVKTIQDQIYTPVFVGGSRILAAGCESQIRFWDLATGKCFQTLAGHQGYVGHLCTSADGKLLVSGSGDSSLLAWDVRAIAPVPELPAKALAAGEFEKLWADLYADDAPRAHEAMWTLVASHRKSLAFLQDKLRAAYVDPQTRIRRFVLDLDSAKFSARDNAARELKRLGKEAESELLRALKRPTSLETRRRVEVLLAALQPGPAPPMTGELLRRMRTIQVLEHIGTGEARGILQNVAGRMPAGSDVREAQAALQRLAARSISN